MNESRLESKIAKCKTRQTHLDALLHSGWIYGGVEVRVLFVDLDSKLHHIDPRVEFPLVAISMK